MPTDIELITTFVNASADAREVLQKLLDWATGTGDTVTFTLSGGVTVTLDSLAAITDDYEAGWNTLKAEFETDFGGVGDITLTRDSTGVITGATQAFSSGDYLTFTYTRDSAGRITAIAWVLYASGGMPRANGSKTITRNTSGQITTIS